MNSTMERLKKTKTALDEGKRGGGPKYKIISESLKESILAGEYGKAARLPSEADLVRRFGVSRMTVVKAFKELQYLGLIERRVGSGTYATSRAEQETRLFGLLIPELGQTEIFEPICQGMTKHSGKHSLLWGNTSGQNSSKEKIAEEICYQYI